MAARATAGATASIRRGSNGFGSRYSRPKRSRSASDAVLSHDALEVYVHRLRRRLEGSGAAIHTLRGLGYVLESEPRATA